MYKLIYKSIIIIAIVIAVDFFMGHLGNLLIAKIPESTLFQSTIYHSLFSKKADMLILGASEASHGLDSKRLKEEFGMTVYNAGCDGHDLRYNDIVLQSFLERCKPKVVVLNLYDAFMNGDLNTNPYVDCYYSLNNAWTKMVDEEYSFWERLKLKSNLYRLNNTLPWLIRALKMNTEPYDGYTPLYGKYDEKVFEDKEKFTVDSIELKHLNSIKNICNDNGISLYFVIAPTCKANSRFSSWLSEYAKQQNVPLKDFSFDQSFYCKYDLFKDAQHLNKNGADLYTKLLIEFIHEQ